MKTTSHFVKQLGAMLGATALLFVNAWAQNDQVELALRGSWPEQPYMGYEAVEVAGNYAYCSGNTNEGGGGRLIVVDLTDPVRPQFKGHCDYSVLGKNSAIGVAGSHAYAVSSDYRPWAEPGIQGSLQVIDVLDPAAPMPIHRLDLPLGLWDIEIVDRHAYVTYNHPLGDGTSWAGGLLVFDLSDPANPSQIGYYETTGLARRVRVVGSRAYLGLGREPGRLEILDVSNPAALALLGACDTGGYEVSFLDVAGQRVGVGDRALTGGFEIYDVQDPASPVRLGGTGAAQVLAVTLSGDYAYTLFNPGVSPRGFTVFDCADPGSPTLLGACEAGQINGLGGTIHLAGRYAYATYGAGYLLVMDINNPAQPTLAGRYEFYLSARDVSVADGRAYVAAASFDSSVRIVDVRDPAHPVELGAYFPPDNVWAGSLHAAGTLACVTSGDPYRWELLDVSDPAQPKLLHRRATTLSNRKAKIAGNTLYLLQYSGATSSGQLQLFNVANPSAPSLLGTCVFTNAECAPTDLDIAGQHGYVADEWSGLIVVDVSAPATPRQVATVPAANAVAVQVVGQQAYLGRRQAWDDDTQRNYARLQILDVSDPAHPVKVGVYNAAADRSLSDLFIDGSRAFLSLSGGNAPGQIQVVDISNPASPRLLTSASTRGSVPGAVQVVEDTVYVGEDMRGLSVFGLSLPGALKLNPPVLSGNTLTLSWNGGPGIKLQKTTSLTNPNWQDVPNTDGQSVAVLPQIETAAFFRLIQPRVELSRNYAVENRQ